MWLTISIWVGIFAGLVTLGGALVAAVKRWGPWIKAQTLDRFTVYVEAPHREVERLQKQVDELAARNDTLSDEVARLREALDALQLAQLRRETGDMPQLSEEDRLRGLNETMPMVREALSAPPYRREG